VATASPLPLPTPAQAAPTDLMLLAAANATGAARPDVIVGTAAQSSSVDQAVQSAQAATQFANVSDLANWLHGQSNQIQHDNWIQYNGDTQNQLRSAGYTPPHLGRGLLGDLVHAVTSPEHPSRWGALAGQGFRDVVQPAGRDVLHPLLQAAGAPLRLVQHVERAASEVIGSPEEAQAAGLPDTGVGRMFSPADWTQAWNRTSKGEAYLDPLAERQALKQYGQETYDLAHKLATGATAAQLIAAAGRSDPSGAGAAALQKQISTPQVQEAVRFLDAAHVSPGRAILTPGFIAKHPAVGHALSGALDGAFDWWTDPTIFGGKMVQTAAAARWLVNTADDVHRLAQMKSVDQAFTRIAEHVAAKQAGDPLAVGNLIREFPKLGQAAPDLIAANADTAAKVEDYFASSSGLSALLQGHGVNAGENGGGALPHLSRAGFYRLQAKAAFHDTVDTAADRTWTAEFGPGDVIDHAAPAGSLSDRLVVGAGRFARRAYTLVPMSRVFRPNDPNALNVFRDIATEFLPAQRVNELLDSFASAPELANKLRVYRSMMVELGQAAGLDLDQATWAAYMGRVSSTAERMYASGGKDVMQVGNTAIHVGLTKADMAQGTVVPDFRGIATTGKQLGVSSVTRGINADWIDKFMEPWRGLTLAREGFALRVSLEELASFVGRNSFGPYLRAQAAQAFKKGMERRMAAETAGEALDTVDDLDTKADANLWQRWAGHLPGAVQDGIRTGADLVREHTVDRVHNYMFALGRALAPDTYRQAVGELLDRGIIDPPELVTSLHGYDDTQQGAKEGMNIGKVKHNGKMVPAEIKPGGGYRGYQRVDTDSPYVQVYQWQLGRIATDDWARHALLSRIPAFHPDTGQQIWGLPARIQNMADVLEADPMWREWSIRSTQNRAGQEVATGEIGRRQAAEDHAAALIDHVDSLVRPGGREIPDLVDHLLATGKNPGVDFLQAHMDQLPREVVGPEIVPVTGMANRITRYTGRLFKNVIGPQINWITRTPQFLHNYTVSREAYLVPGGVADMWRDEGMTHQAVADMVHEGAMARAVNMTIPFIHNPELRSEMSVLTRNLAPFWFAQEQFYKRWARTFTYSPAAFRRLQLISHGVTHSGLTQTDPATGKQYFVYPGSNLVQDVLAHGVSVLTGGHFNAVLPVNAGLIGQVNMLNPGLERVGLPNWGPLAILPMDGLKSIDPHMTRAINKVEGSVAANSGFIKALLPATVAHAVEVAEPQWLSSSQYASAQMQAMQYLDATGHGLGTPAINQVAGPDVAHPQPGDYYLDNGNPTVYQPDGRWQRNTPDALNGYRQRVQNWARIFMVTRLIYGFNGPAAPENMIAPTGLHNDLANFMKAMPFNEAMAAFVAAHPNATAYTVFQSQNETGGFLPATKAAMDFLDHNPGLLKDHSLGAPYFIPAPDTSGAYDANAYTEQMQMGLRQRKDPKTFLNQIEYQDAAATYFKNEDMKNQMLAVNTGNKTQIDAQWTDWSRQFLAANPVFADLLGQSGTPGVIASAQTGRQQIMSDVNAALRDGSAPQTPQTSALKTLLAAYVMWQGMVGGYNNTGANSISAGMTRGIDQQFAEWLAGFVKEQPGVQPLVDRAIRPDLSSTLTALAAAGTPVAI
jgi:hypothetical protein